MSIEIINGRKTRTIESRRYDITESVKTIGGRNFHIGDYLTHEGSKNTYRVMEFQAKGLVATLTKATCLSRIEGNDYYISYAVVGQYKHNA